MQRDSMDELIPGCLADRCDVYTFWVLMKGLLAGRIGPNHVFDQDDVRPGYEIFQGDSRRRTHLVLDGMQEIAQRTGQTIAQLSVGWALAQDGVSAALVGARRGDQIRELAGARPLKPEIAGELDSIVGRALAT